MKKDAVRYLILAFAAIATVAILVVWKKNDRASAYEELKQRYGADIVDLGGELTVGCDSELLIDLVDFARVVARAGEPAILDLTGAPKLESLAGIEALPGLRSLVAIDCPRLVSTDGVTRHPKLQELVFVDSRSLSDVSAIRDLPSLETLDLSGCEAVASLGLSGLPKLKNLYLGRCRGLSSLDVSSVPGLRQLYLDGCSEIASVDGLSSLAGLTDLDLSNATALTSLEGISGLESLVVLDLRNVDVEDFSEVGLLPALRVLRMGGQTALESLEPFAGLSSLREIHLEACPNFSSLAGIPSGLTQYVGFTHCPKLETIEGIEVAKGLEQLDLSGSAKVSSIAPVAELDNLVQLSLAGCRSVTDVSPVAGLEKLAVVLLGGSGVVPAAVEKLETANPDIIFDFAVAE